MLSVWFAYSLSAATGRSGITCTHPVSSRLLHHVLLPRGVKILAESNAGFAVRSDGHSPVAGVANIDDGVLIVTRHLNGMKVMPTPSSLGAQYFSMGSGKRWGGYTIF